MKELEFAKRIKELRIKNNYTQKEFADKLGVTYQAVSKWENGKNMPDIILLKEISNLFNVDLDELLTGKMKNKSNKKIWFIVLSLLFIVIILFVLIIINNSSNFEFKTITSNCDEFELTGSAAYNDKKTSIYISNVDYCGEEQTDIYKSFSCNLYESYRDTNTKIGSCGESNKEESLDKFLESVNINVNNYVASCKMFKSSTLYMEIQAINLDNKIITYQIPINLEDNCKK